MRVREPWRALPLSSDVSEDGNTDNLGETGTIIVVSPAGDLILDVRDESGKESFAYRVELECLSQASPYFSNLLHPGKFGEGARVRSEYESLKSRYGNVAQATPDELPHVAIMDIGRISKVNTIKNITADFLRALHGLDLSTASPPIPNLANLAIVADRFDALTYLSKYVRRRRYLQGVDGKTRTKSGASLPEERVRQRLLIGIMLDHAPWVATYSKRLIINGSTRWKPGASEDDRAALWWDLPQGVEDELIYRRECILETINSLQSHFLKLYTSGERQCKLGYDNSVQCDSFQLGEMVRFFIRLGTLRLQGMIYDSETSQAYAGDIDRLIDTLRQCPSYQVDRNHAHCGLRTRLIPLLDLIQNHLSLDAGSLDVGICADCWQNHRAEYAWSEAKRPLMWTRSDLSRRRIQGDTQGSLCLARHHNVRDMFAAFERDWTARDPY